MGWIGMYMKGTEMAVEVLMMTDTVDMRLNTVEPERPLAVIDMTMV